MVKTRIQQKKSSYYGLHDSKNGTVKLRDVMDYLMEQKNFKYEEAYNAVIGVVKTIYSCGHTEGDESSDIELDADPVKCPECREREERERKEQERRRKRWR